MAYADIAGVSPEHAEVVPGPAGSSEKVRSMLMRASGDITVVLKDGSIEEYSAQTAYSRECESLGDLNRCSCTSAAVRPLHSATGSVTRVRAKSSRYSAAWAS